jgi:hypothetical protein
MLSRTWTCALVRHLPRCLRFAAGAVFVLWAFPARANPVTLIVDTDIGFDVDDAGALAVANKLADFGEVNLLAMGFATSNQYGAAAINAINSYYGRPRSRLERARIMRTPVRLTTPRFSRRSPRDIRTRSIHSARPMWSPSIGRPWP